MSNVLQFPPLEEYQPLNADAIANAQVLAGSLHSRHLVETKLQGLREIHRDLVTYIDTLEAQLPRLRRGRCGLEQDIQALQTALAEAAA